MIRTIVGLFENAQDAEKVRAELIQRAIPAGRIQIVDRDAEQQYRATAKKKTSIVHYLFGDLGTTPEDLTFYGEGIAKGGVLVMVRADEPAVEVARTIMERRGGEVQTSVRIFSRITEMPIAPTEKLPAGQGYDAYEPEFRRHWQSNYAKAGGGTYEQWVPAYRSGCDLASDASYANADWATVEPEARRRFMTSNPSSKWGQFKDSIRYAWERARAKLRAA
jgi:hypothetical protein